IQANEQDPEEYTRVILHDNLNFTGTLVIEGDVVLDGQNITLTAVDGFPAIVATGKIIITNNARNVTINGVVSAKEGIVPASDDTSNSSTTINGALVTGETGYSSSLGGTHRLNHWKGKASILDFGITKQERIPQVVVLDWND
ncbi:hypothetical protein LCGC14_3039920, partial [marine sediment metagenome]